MCWKVMRDQRKRHCIIGWTECLSMNRLLLYFSQRGGDPECTYTRPLWLKLSEAEHSHRIPTPTSNIQHLTFNI
ncbi:hypothetical protein EJ06DRAFT_270892 [Trichodelitschia bisporula]|uniref:Uncharacterized protein n=1 Tax=Trichodelitschia bisporula TaxID=703511 RepID=A0A6G1HI38_9PEZI|nr:hypothetical protein EJ06DRAFT_270892 [Trichodelitschia bisporula]